MRALLYRWWQNTKSSFWFVPSLIVLMSIGLAVGMIAIDVNFDLPFRDEWPLFFGASASGSRGVLTAVASSMITVTGVVFSMTIVALTLTSSQYSSRVLHTFMRDRTNQSALGIFLGIFAYSLTVLRTIRSGDEGSFVPSMAVLMGLLLAFLGIIVLIHFIHHIAISIQASTIISAVTKDTIEVIDRLLPEGAGSIAQKPAEEELQSSLDESTLHPILAIKSRYVEVIDDDALMELAKEYGTLVRMERAIGDFVIENTPLVSVSSKLSSNIELCRKLNSAYVLGSRRSIEDDIGFGIDQLIDIARRALSPGINDTTTAIMCVQYLTAIFVRLATRQFPRNCRFEEGRLRVIAKEPSFEELFNEAFDHIRQNAEGNVAMLEALCRALEEIAYVATISSRRDVIARQAKLTASVADSTITEPEDLEKIKASLDRLRSHFMEGGSRA